MKRGISLLLAFLFCLSAAACSAGSNSVSNKEIVSGSGLVEFTSSSAAEKQPVKPESPDAISQSQTTMPEGQNAPETAKPKIKEVRSVWISYLELNDMLTGKSESDYRTNIAKAFDNCMELGLNTVILQVRPFGDAIYPSKIFPQSYLFTGTEGEVGEAPFDALQIALDEAHKRKLRLEAWINPYRIRRKADKELNPSNPANAMLKSGNATKMGEVITYNPASAEAQKLIVDGVMEIVNNYNVDGIHFDDYFYPTTDAAFDADDYRKYQLSGGDKSLADWRRSNVMALVSKVHDAIKISGSPVIFGISPQGNIDNNINVQFVDIAEIIKADLVDYICPQMYFGFKNTGCPYQSTIEAFNQMAKDTNVDIYIGLATYKFNKIDSWAGSGKDEWIGTTDIIKRQVESARKLSQYGGFVLYRYDSTFDSAFYAGDSRAQAQAKSERDSLKTIL